MSTYNDYFSKYKKKYKVGYMLVLYNSQEEILFWVKDKADAKEAIEYGKSHLDSPINFRIYKGELNEEECCT